MSHGLVRVRREPLDIEFMRCLELALEVVSAAGFRRVYLWNSYSSDDDESMLVSYKPGVTPEIDLVIEENSVYRYVGFVGESSNWADIITIDVSEEAIAATVLLPDCKLFHHGSFMYGTGYFDNIYCYEYHSYVRNTPGRTISTLVNPDNL